MPWAMGLQEANVPYNCIRKIDFLDVVELLCESLELCLDVRVAYRELVWAKCRAGVGIQDFYSASGKAMRQKMGAIGFAFPC